MGDKYRNWILIALLAAQVSACGMTNFTPRETNPVVRDIVGPGWGDSFGKQGSVLGIVATRADRRIALTRLSADAPTRGKFCAEPSPDVAEAVADRVVVAFEAAVEKAGVGGKGSVEYLTELVTAIQALTFRTQGLQFYRDSMWNLCLAYINGIIDSDNYVASEQKIRDVANGMIMEELRLRNGNLAVNSANLTATLPDRQPGEPAGKSP